MVELNSGSRPSGKSRSNSVTGTSSVPVGMMATLGRRRTLTRVTPAASRAPWAQGVISTPSGRTISPLTRSSPTRRTCCQGKVGASTVMGSASGSGTCSTMITASVPGGMTCPVLMGKASRPMARRLGWSGVAPKVPAAATAKPSMAAWWAAGEDLPGHDRPRGHPAGGRGHRNLLGRSHGVQIKPGQP